MGKLHIISEDKVFDHPWEKIFIEKVETDNGDRLNYLISVPNDFVIVVPFLDDKNMLMVKQYKHGAQADLLGFPAGFINANEDPLTCARREMKEEIQYKAEEVQLIAKLSENPTRCRNAYYIVFAYDCTLIKKQSVINPDKFEGQVKPLVVPITELLQPDMLAQIKAGPMLSAIPYILKQSSYSSSLDV